MNPLGLSPLELDAVRSCFVGTVEASQESGGLVTITATGHGGEQTASDATVRERVHDVPVVFPYGYLARPAGDTETVLLESPAGVLAIAHRHKSHTDWPALQDGEVMIGNPGNGSYAVFDTNGDVIVEPAARKVVKLGKSATSSVLIADGNEGKKTAAMATWMSQVETVCNGVATGSVTPLSSAVDPIATVNSATKAVAE